MAYRFKTRSTTPTEIRLTDAAIALLLAEGAIGDFPDAANVLTIDTTNGVAGTFDESARNTDPGVANVESGVSYKIQNIDKVGEYVIPPETPHFIFNETTVLSRGS